jgi:hypothetical protein
MQNSNPDLNAPEKPISLDKNSTLLLVNSGNFYFNHLINFIKIAKFKEDEIIELIIAFLSVANDKDKSNIPCKDFVETIKSFKISDDDKKVKLMTGFLLSDKIKISSLQEYDFIEPLSIKEDSEKQTLRSIRDTIIYDEKKEIIEPPSIREYPAKQTLRFISDVMIYDEKKERI